MQCEGRRVDRVSMKESLEGQRIVMGVVSEAEDSCLMEFGD